MARLFSPVVPVTTITRSFSASETFVMPVGVTNLLTVSGRGGIGEPETVHPGEDYYDRYRTTTTVFDPHDPPYGIDYVDGPNFEERTYTSASGPADNCVTLYFASTHRTTTVCMTYFYGNTGTTTTPATTGASSTGFSQTFPGGTGGAATTRQFTNVPVVPGASYPVVITVPGGFITITYNV